MRTRTIMVQAKLIDDRYAPVDMTITAEFSEECAQWHWSLVMGGKPSTWHGPFSSEEEAYEAAADFLEGTVIQK